MQPGGAVFISVSWLRLNCPETIQSLSVRSDVGNWRGDLSRCPSEYPRGAGVKMDRRHPSTERGDGTSAVAESSRGPVGRAAGGLQFAVNVIFEDACWVIGPRDAQRQQWPHNCLPPSSELLAKIRGSWIKKKKICNGHKPSHVLFLSVSNTLLSALQGIVSFSISW